MESQPKSLQDIMRARGIDLEAIKRQSEIEENTCIVRALGSVVGTPPPEHIYDLRVIQVNRAPTILDLYYEARELGINPRTQMAKEYARDEQNILTLINIAISGDTDFAKRLAGFSPKWISADIQTLRRLVSEGIPVIVSGLFSFGNIVDYHAMHIGIDPSSGNLISLSDTGQQIRLKQGQLERALVFYPVKSFS